MGAEHPVRLVVDDDTLVAAQVSPTPNHSPVSLKTARSGTALHRLVLGQSTRASSAIVKTTFGTFGEVLTVSAGLTRS